MYCGHREQARSHSFVGCSRILRIAANPVGAGLPAMADYQATLILNVPASSRASSLPQFCWLLADFADSRESCGSGLARDGGLSGDIDIECAGLIAGQPAPTVLLVARGFCG
jgi:hypothetical protein